MKILKSGKDDWLRRMMILAKTRAENPKSALARVRIRNVFGLSHDLPFVT